MPLWMVRAGKHGEQENFALDKGSVVIGWDEFTDLSKVSSFEKMKDLYRSIYPELSVPVGRPEASSRRSALYETLPACWHSAGIRVTARLLPKRCQSVWV